MANSLTDLLELGKMNLLNPNINDDVVESSTDRVQLITNHVGFLHSVFANRAALGQMRHTSTAEMHLAYPDVKLVPKNAVDIKTLSQHATKVLVGKFLLCRTILPANQMRGLMTVVEDPKGEQAITVALYNYSASVPGVTNYDHVLPTGTFLAIKNPWFKAAASGAFAIRCENPSQVELLSKKAVTDMFPGVTWRGQIPNIGFFPNEDFWLSVEGTEKQTFEALKKLGNVSFLEKRFTDSIRWYKLALDYAGTNDEATVDVFSNKAAAFLSLRCFHRALEDTEKVLKMKTTHVKGIYRKTKALMGLRMYDEAADFILKKLKTHDELDDNKDLHQLSVSAKALASQLKSNVVDVDMLKLVSLNQATEYTDDVIQFTGPVEKKLFKDGKGRGLVAAENILPGQLLLSSKALAFAKSKSNVMRTDLSLNYGNDGVNIGPNHDALVAQIAYKIYFEPEESGPEIYSLFAGHQLGYLSEDSQESNSVSMKRIDLIATHNAFGSRVDLSFDSMIHSGSLSMPQFQSHSFSGLWKLPSLLNHSCSDSNAIWSTHGDILIVRAIKPIKQGEEILISYVPANASYKDRLNLFKCHSFVCQCRLCKLDEVDAKSGREKTRSKVISNLNSLQDKMESSPAAIKDAVGYITKLETMRKGSSNLNVSLVSDSVERVAQGFSAFGKLLEGYQLLEKIYHVEKETGLLLGAIVTATKILRFLCAMRNMELLNKWIDLLKKDLIAAFGSIEPMRAFGDKALLELQMLNIDFFKK